MTATPPPAPAARCLTHGKESIVLDPENRPFCEECRVNGPNDPRAVLAQPAPTPSGDDARRMVESAWAAYLDEQSETVAIRLGRYPTTEFQFAFEAGAAALQEARDEALKWHRDAINTDALAQDTRGALIEAEGRVARLEARLREVEGERDRMREALQRISDDTFISGAEYDAKYGAGAWNQSPGEIARETLGYPPAASRPVPAHDANEFGCMKPAYFVDDNGNRRCANCGWCSQTSHQHGAATPSTDEEGR